MLDRAVQQKTAIAIALAESDTLIPNLSAYEWKTAEQLVAALQPFESVTVMMSGDKYPTASMIIPAISQLKEILNSYEDLNDFRTELVNNIDTRWPDVKNDEILSVATFIDPRFKLVSFSADERQEVISCVTTLCKETFQTVSNVEEEAGKQKYPVKDVGDREFWSSFSNKVESEYKPNSFFRNCKSVENEITAYLEETPIPITKSAKPLDWWNQAKQRFPHLFKVARCFLCIPATSIPSERIFSKAGQIVTQKRNQLKGSLVEMLVFLHANWDTDLL